MSARHGCCFYSLCILCSTFFCFLLALTVFWSIFNPEDPKFSITNAALTQFNFTRTNTTLYYNLAVLEIAMRNPNSLVGINYRDIVVTASYRNRKFAMETLTTTPFYQGHKNTLMIQVPFEGYQVVDFEQSDISEFNSETSAGVYSIDLQLAFRFGLRFGKFNTGYYEPKIQCKLKVPLSTYNEISENGFNTTKCGNVNIF